VTADGDSVDDGGRALASARYRVTVVSGGADAQAHAG